MNQSQSTIEVPPEQVVFLREQVLSPLTLDEIGDLMGVSRSTFSDWMQKGISGDSTYLDRYEHLEHYIEKKGARAVMEGRIVPILRGWQSGWRCRVLVQNDEKFVQCRSRRMMDEKFCYEHLEKIKNKGAMYLTVDGDIPGFRSRRGFHGEDRSYPPLLERCSAICYGGNKCLFVGMLDGGLCPKHRKKLERLGKLQVLNKDLAETVYAEAAG